MIEKAKTAYQCAYAPYSQFSVGVCLRSEDNQLFGGCNVENAAYPVGQCAEASAIGALIASGQRYVKEVVIMVSQGRCPPCGACCQRLSEFSAPETPIHLCDMKGARQTITLGELFPLPFNAKTLESSS